MIHVWWNVKNQVSQKPVVVSNIPNDKTLLRNAQREEASSNSKREAGYFLIARHHAYNAFSIYKKIGDTKALAELAQSLGDIDRQLENFPSAKKWYSQAESFFLKDKTLHLESLDARVGYALCLRGECLYEEAILKLKTCLKIYKKNKDWEGMSFVLWAMGTTYRFLGQLSEAEDSLRNSIKIYKKINDVSGMAYALAGLGGTLRMRGLAKDSEHLYRRAQKTFQKLNDGFGIAYTYCGISNGLRMQNIFQEGLHLSQKAENIYRKLKQKGPLGFVLWSQAQTFIYQKKFKSALLNLTEAKEIFSSVGDRRGIVYIDLGWGNYHTAEGNHKLAQTHFRKAFDNAKKYRLGLEKMHAARQIFNYQHPYKEFHWAAYKQVGVDLNHFRKYRTLP